MQTRLHVKVHDSTKGIQIAYDLKHRTINNVQSYKTDVMKKYSVDSVVYDDRIISCFYTLDTHPYSVVFSELFLNLCLTFYKCGMTVLYDKRVDDIIYVDVFPTHKVKDFKE